MRPFFYKKFLSGLASFSLLLNQFLPFLSILVNVPSRPVYAQEVAEPLTFDQSTNSFSFTDENHQQPDYLFAYRTDEDKTEVVLGKDQPIYAGTCSEDGNCVDHQVTKGILNIQVKDQTDVNQIKFAFDHGDLIIIDQTTVSDLELSDEDNSWLKTLFISRRYLLHP